MLTTESIGFVHNLTTRNCVNTTYTTAGLTLWTKPTNVTGFTTALADPLRAKLI